MHSCVAQLPEDQLAPLKAAYAREIGARRLRTLLILAIVLGLVLLSSVIADVRPITFIDNIHRFTNYIVRLFYLDNGRPVWTDFGEWFWGLRKWLLQLADTLLIAYVGTILGALGAFFLCFYAAANLNPGSWSRAIVRRSLEFCRTVPELVFALIFVIAFGLGPVPGVLAIAIHTIGALGKLFSEVVENIDMKPVEGATACGASWGEGVRFAVVPQVLSNFASYALLRFEINVRGAAVMGFVGAGGIGQDLVEAIRKFYYSDVSAILLLVIATVMIIDLLTERLRHSLITLESGR